MNLMGWFTSGYVLVVFKLSLSLLTSTSVIDIPNLTPPQLSLSTQVLYENLPYKFPHLHFGLRSTIPVKRNP